MGYSKCSRLFPKDTSIRLPSRLAFFPAVRSAHAGLDFASTEGLLTWPEGAAGPQSIWVQLLEDEFGEGEQEFSVVLRLEGQTEAVLLSDQTARVTVSGPGSARWERAGRKRWQKPAQERRPSSREVGTSVEEDGVIEDMGLEAESDEEKESGENGLLPATRALHSGSKWKHKVNETREAKGLAPLEFSKRMHIPEAWERFIEEGPPGATAGEEEKGEESPTNGGAPGAAHRASSQHGRRSESPNGKRAEMLDAQELEQRAAEAGKAAAVSGRAELVLKGAHRGKDLSTFLVNNARVMPAKKLRALIGSIYRAKQAANAVRQSRARNRLRLQRAW